MISINTNLSSLIIQNNLKSATGGLNQAIERMTTGFKINGAKDNAANYSISTNLTTKIGAYNVAEDNVSMGLDMLSTAESSINEIDNNFSKLRTLAVQLKNGTYSKQSRQAINLEANSLISEIKRLYSSANYNGIKLFAGESPPKQVHPEVQGFIKSVNKRDTSGMSAMESIADSETILDGVYSISTAEDLVKLAKMTNEGKICGGDFVLVDDIDLKKLPESQTGEGWVPIGNSTNRFNANFDGNGCTISNLYINRPKNNFQGLFGATNGTIENIIVHNVNITGQNYVGGVIGRANNSVNNCSVTGYITGEEYVGGITGCLSSSNKIIENSYAYVSLNSKTSRCGGITGSLTNDCKLLNNTTIGSILGNYRAGGLVGWVASNVFIKECSSSIDVACTEGHIGGLVGEANKNLTIENSCFTGSVAGTTFVGGIIGTSTDVEILNCYSIGDVNGSSYSAGFIGYTSIAKLRDCYSTGKVPSGTYNAAFVSRMGTASILSNCTYYSGVNPGMKAIVFGKPTFTREELYDDLVPTYSVNANLQVGTNSNGGSLIGIKTSFSIRNLGVLTYIGIDDSIDYLSRIDKYLEEISLRQTKYGATMNRLESALDEISIQRENLISGRSTIRDTDIAKESSRYIQTRILQEASATLLATANQTPAIALQLL